MDPKDKARIVKACLIGGSSRKLVFFPAFLERLGICYGDEEFTGTNVEMGEIVVRRLLGMEGIGPNRERRRKAKKK